MNCLGIYNGELYKLETTPAGEVRLEANGPRGEGLARAMRARKAGGIYYLTPGRAEKWRRLFRLGFTARRRRILNQFVWCFELPGEKPVSLAAALKTADPEDLA